MRELNECKAEIFRLSEKRIKARKKAIKRAFALCIPLCIVSLILSVAVIPAMMPTKEANDEAQIELPNLVNGSSGSYVCSYTKIVISDSEGDSVREITDKAQVTQIFELIFSVDRGIGGSGAADENFAVADGSGTLEESFSTVPKNEDKKENFSVNEKYTFAFIDVSGTKTVYMLTGNELQNVPAGTVTVLSQEQLEELMSYF